MILKYNDFFILINTINYIFTKNNSIYNKLCLLKYFNKIYKFNIVFKKNVIFFKKYHFNMYILLYLYKFYILYIEVFLIKNIHKKYINMYIYLNFFSFFFKFLNWYCNFLYLNSHVFILDNNSLRILNDDILLNINKKFLIDFIISSNCKFFINLDEQISKNYCRLFYEFDVYMLDISNILYYKNNKNNILQLFFLMRNLVISYKIFENL